MLHQFAYYVLAILLRGGKEGSLAGTAVLENCTLALIVKMPSDVDLAWYLASLSSQCQLLHCHSETLRTAVAYNMTSRKITPMGLRLTGCQ